MIQGIRNLFYSIIALMIMTSCSANIPLGNNADHEIVQRATPSILNETPFFEEPEQEDGSESDNSETKYQGKTEYICKRSKLDEIPKYLGSIVLVDEEHNLSLLNMESHDEIFLGQVSISNGVYTTKDSLIFIDKQKNKIIQADVNGFEIHAIAAEENWIEIIGLYNETEILVSEMPLNNNGSWHPPSKPILVNLNTGERKEILTEGLDLYQYISGPPHIGRYGYSMLAFNSNMKYVVFPTMLTGSGMGLWNYMTKKEIVKLGTIFPYTEPVWNHDGDKFMISLEPEYYHKGTLIYKNAIDDLQFMGGEDIFLIDLNGKISRLTYFTTSFESEEQYYRWSEDDEEIIFWKNDERNDSNWSIVKQNIETGESSEYCGDNSNEPFLIYLSPDNGQAISTTYDKQMNKNIVIIDFNENTTTIIPTKKTVVGWIE